MSQMSDVIPSECISLTIKGDWAHFRRVDGTVVKQSYRIMPRTTVAGLLAAIVGAPRDSYYETFDLDTASIAVTPTEPFQTTNIATNGVSTAKENLRRPRSSRKGRSRNGLKIRYPDTTENRQQQNYQYLVDPGYRIDVWTEDSEFYEELKDHLTRGEYVYTPTLGLSECLAEVEFQGVFTPEPIDLETRDRISVDSAVPNSLDAIVPEKRLETERSPAAMDQVAGGGRKTTAFTTYGYSPEAAPLDVLVNRDLGAPVATIEDRTVMFV